MSEQPFGPNGVNDLAEVAEHVEDAPIEPTPLDEDTSERDDTSPEQVAAEIERADEAAE